MLFNDSAIAMDRAQTFDSTKGAPPATLLLMHCPRCDSDSLIEMDRQGITIDRCQSCRGVWLDRGELEKLIARESEDVLDSGTAARGNVEAPRKYRRADSDHDDDDRARHHGKKRSAWWDIFD